MAKHGAVAMTLEHELAVTVAIPATKQALPIIRIALEQELAAMVAIHDRSVGMDFRRVNYKIAKIQNAIAVSDRLATVASKAVLELACGKAHLSLEEYLDIEFNLLGVTPHIAHIRQAIAHTAGFPRAVTIASVDPINVATMKHVLFAIEMTYWRTGRPRSQSIASYMKQQLEADGCAGIAVCDYRDQFSRKRGRIIAKGRLFKLLRKEKANRIPE